MVKDSVVLSKRTFTAVPEVAKRAAFAARLVVLKAKFQLRERARAMSDDQLIESYLTNFVDNAAMAKACRQEIDRRFRMGKTRGFWRR